MRCLLRAFVTLSIAAGLVLASVGCGGSGSKDGTPNSNLKVPDVPKGGRDESKGGAGGKGAVDPAAGKGGAKKP